MPTQQITFYTVADANYFPGLVAMVNSLRLNGHDDRLLVLDCGLSPAQRSVLGSQCDFHIVDRTTLGSPFMFQPYVAKLGLEGVIVFIDSDVIVTSSLEPFLELARAGKIFAMTAPSADRCHPAWTEMFGLQGELRDDQAYVNMGLVGFSATRYSKLLDRWWELCEPISARGDVGVKGNRGPLVYWDQDVFNALLMSEIPAGALVALSPQMMPPDLHQSHATVVEDFRTLTCRHEGTRTVALHYLGRPKPWQKRVRSTGLWDNAYTRLLSRLLIEDDLSVRAPVEELPTWLLPGRRGSTAFDLLVLLGRLRVAERRVRAPIGRLRSRFRAASVTTDARE